jgi:hypothetical protein
LPKVAVIFGRRDKCQKLRRFQGISRLSCGGCLVGVDSGQGGTESLYLVSSLIYTTKILEEKREASSGMTVFKTACRLIFDVIRTNLRPALLPNFSSA